MVGSTMSSRIDVTVARAQILAHIIHDAVYAVNHRYEGCIDYPEWNSLSDADQQNYVNAVLGVAADPTLTPELLHVKWAATKFVEGWKHGPVRDYVAKTHPSLVAYSQLSDVEKAKGVLFLNMVRALEPLL